MEYQYLKIRREKSTLWVEIKNPPVNFLTVAMLEELFDLVKQASRDDSVRVFILTGGIEDVYIMHFSIPELLTLSKDNKKLLLNLFVKSKITGAILKYVTTYTNWLMDWFGWYETLMLKLPWNPSRLYFIYLLQYRTKEFFIIQLIRTRFGMGRIEDEGSCVSRQIPETGSPCGRTGKAGKAARSAGERKARLFT